MIGPYKFRPGESFPERPGLEIDEQDFDQDAYEQGIEDEADARRKGD